MASNRAPVLAELPRAGAPPAFGSYGEWEGWVERYVGLGVMEDYTRVWWDVRPHPVLGTLEVRVPDQPTDVRLSAAFAALLQALCALALEGGLDGASPRVDYVQNRWSAARFGPRANLIHPDGVRSRPRPSSAQSCSSACGRPPRGSARRDVLARIDPGRCEADRQSASRRRARRPRSSCRVR